MQNATPTLPHILLVDDDPTVIQALSKALVGLGRLRFATNGIDGLRLALQHVPDLMLLDSEMPGMSGMQLWQALRQEPSLRDLPVIFVTSHSSEEMEEAGLALGAADFIAKPVRPGIVAARVRTQLRLKEATDRLRQLASTDGLTQAANRRALDEALDNEWRRARRAGRPLSLLMLDVDHFKRYNDSYGHPQGDACLVAVAEVLRQCAHRPGDFVARYGGEEFAVVLPDTEGPGARSVAANILQQLAQRALPHRASDLGRVSVSIGVASFDALSSGWDTERAALRSGVAAPTGDLSVAELLAVADRALYRAKAGGRARAESAQIDVGAALAEPLQQAVSSA